MVHVQNNGTCSNNKNDTSPYYTCGCPYGYSGQDCQIGKKILMKKSIFFYSKIKKNICELKLLAILIHVKIMVHVQNNGKCSNNKNDTSPYYTCGCPYGYSGQDCQIGIKILMKKSLFFYSKIKKKIFAN
jgi:hypothetical protein